MMPVSNSLYGKRLLIVEDEILVAMELGQTMEDMGAEIAATTGSLSEALEMAEMPLDGALVDVQLGEEKSFVLVEKLLAAGVPLILTTGYDVAVLPEHLRGCPRIAKPILPTRLEKLVQEVFHADRE
jgi:ActR/RegA family two-component response regulator